MPVFDRSSFAGPLPHRYHARMQWVLIGSMTSAVSDALRRHEQHVHSQEDLGLAPDASPEDLLMAAHKRQWDILTTDASIASTPFDRQLRFGRSIVYLQLQGGDVEQDDAIDRLFQRYKRLTPSRLYTVTGSRVKIRQLPGK